MIENILHAITEVKTETAALIKALEQGWRCLIADLRLLGCVLLARIIVWRKLRLEPPGRQARR